MGKILKVVLLVFGWTHLAINLNAQSNDPDANQVIEQQIEFISEQLESEDLDLTTITQGLFECLENPININSKDIDLLSEYFVLTDLQLYALKRHIEINGPLISFYELQSVQGFSVETIRRIAPFVKVAEISETKNKSIPELVKSADNLLLLRYYQILEEKRGYSSDADPDKAYLGSPNRLYARYRMNYLNQLSIGFTAEKDPGEQFTFNNRTQGFDFYSGHLYIGNRGKLQHFVLGDYQIQFGQGLAAWSSLSFGKSADVLNIKRNARGIRPYTSVDENRFMRGAAIGFQFNKISVSAYASRNQIDASVDTIGLIDDAPELAYSSFDRSGMHRTLNELSKKNTITESAIGANIQYTGAQIELGANFIAKNSSAGFSPDVNEYNQFAKQNLGNAWYSSVYYTYFVKNINLFGETAVNHLGGIATINGALMSINRNLDAGFLVRSYDKKYVPELHGAFSESRSLSENGTYLAIKSKLRKNVTLNVYADFFQFNWLKFLVDAPSRGTDYLAQFDVKPSKIWNWYIRVQSQTKSRNNSADEIGLTEIQPYTKTQIRFHNSYKVGKTIQLNSRLQIGEYRINNSTSRGWLVYQDLIIKPDFRSVFKGKSELPFALQPIQLKMRYALFDTPEYETRIYAYEHDVLYRFSVPAYYGKGMRYYVVLSYKPARKVSIEAKYAVTKFIDRYEIGSGNELINGNVRSEFRTQLRIQF